MGKAAQNSDVGDRCLERLRELPFVCRATLGASTIPEIDAALTLETPGGRHVFPCEVKNGPLRGEGAQMLVHFAARHPGLTLLAPLIGSQLGDFFERNAINFMDAAGNCNVRVGEKYLARIQGRKAEDARRSDRGLRAPAYRALFALLVNPELAGASSRSIAADAEVSPQTANELRHWLVERGLLLHTNRRHRWTPRGSKEAIALWLAGFSTVLGPSLLIGRFRAQETDAVELERRMEPILDAACPWAYGGGAACARMTGYYRGDRTVLYTHDAPAHLWKELRLVRDGQGPIALMRAPTRTALRSPAPRCVQPLLAYADLLAEGNDRAREAAGEIYARFISDLEKKT